MYRRFVTLMYVIWLVYMCTVCIQYYSFTIPPPVAVGVLDLCEGCSSSRVYIYFKLAASQFALNGKARVMLTKMRSLSSVLSRDGPRERADLGDIIRAVLSWDPCLRGLSGWYQSCPGEWLGPGGGWPLFDVLADVEFRGSGCCWPLIIQHQYGALAIWLRTRSS